MSAFSGHMAYAADPGPWLDPSQVARPGQPLVNNPQATGTGSIALGSDGIPEQGPASASGDSAIALGAYTEASRANSVSIGSMTRANAQYAVAIGFGGNASGGVATALGNHTEASGKYATAMGSQTKASAEAATAMGEWTLASGKYAVAMGAGRFDARANSTTPPDASKPYQSADGTWHAENTGATGDYSTSMGKETTASGESSTAMGEETVASGKASLAGGSSSVASGDYAIALGNQSRAEGENSFAAGNGSQAIGENAAALAGGTASGINSIAMGNQATANDESSVALGTASYASGAGQIAIGENAATQAVGAIALGQNSVSGRPGFAGAGYDPSTNTMSTNNSMVWQPTTGALAVGDESNNVTRQIIAVAAGREDTDAVNVAQLKSLANKVDNSGMKYGGDTGSVIDKKLNQQVNVIGGIRDENKLTTADNIGVVSDGSSNLKVRLAKNLDLGSDGSITTGNTTINNNGVTVHNGPAVTKDGVDAGKKTITNVKAGTNPTDAVNKNQLDEAIGKANGEVNRVARDLNRLDSRVNKVGSHAAALAALHPQDFDPDDKWDFAAGYGHYKDANAMALGAFYRPNEDTMLSLGGSFGGGENMINAGLSLKLGQGNHVSRARVAVAKDVSELNAKVARLEEQNRQLMDTVSKLVGVSGEHLNVNFPDVPKNHWAYQYVKSLADRGYLQGYPDGEFKGDRPMTRYEYAAIVYRALQNGAPVDADMGRSLGEFGPEIEKVASADRFRVDRIAGKDNDRYKIERVRVNDKDDKAQNDFRDVYGSHIHK